MEDGRVEDGAVYCLVVLLEEDRPTELLCVEGRVVRVPTEGRVVERVVVPTEGRVVERVVVLPVVMPVVLLRDVVRVVLLFMSLATLRVVERPEDTAELLVLRVVDLPVVEETEREVLLPPERCREVLLLPL